jgi:excisionase family DNA binding protein
MLSPDQAASYLGLGSRWSIYRLVGSGQLPRTTIAGKLRIDRLDLDMFIERSKRAVPLSPNTLRTAHRVSDPRRTRLAPLSRKLRNGDKPVTAATQVAVVSRRPTGASDMPSVTRVPNERH